MQQNSSNEKCYQSLIWSSNHSNIVILLYQPGNTHYLLNDLQNVVGNRNLPYIQFAITEYD